MVTPVGDWWPAGQLGVQYSSQGLQDSWGMRRSWSGQQQPDLKAFPAVASFLSYLSSRKRVSFGCVGS